MSIDTDGCPSSWLILLTQLPRAASSPRVALWRRLRAAGAARCHLEVRLDNAGALALYHALGFEICGRRQGYYRDGSDALVLRRDL